MAIAGSEPYDDQFYDDRASASDETRREERASIETLKGYIGHPNIAEELDEFELAMIGARVVREFDVDVNSRSGWWDKMEEASKLALQVPEEKNYPWPNPANIQYPLITTASIQFAARAYPAIVNGRNVVKGQVRGNDQGVPKQQMQAPMQQPQPGLLPQPGAWGGPPPVGPGPGSMPTGMAMPPGAAGPMPPPGPEGALQAPPEPEWEVEPGAKRKRADRVSRHMSWQLLDEMEEWEEDTDLLLSTLPIMGCAFRKTFYDPSMARNRSELVLAANFVVNYHAKSLLTVPRCTQIVPLYPHEIEERKRTGKFLDVDLGLPHGGEANDEDQPHDFLEQHRLCDLDGDGYPEPYIVTVHKDTHKVVRIVARFEEEGIYLNDKNQVAKIEAIQYFTRYIFLPAPDGGFYGLGFGGLLKPLNDAINTVINQMLDAGHLQNTGGGFIGYGLKIRGGEVRFEPGEFKRVRLVTGTIRDNVYPLDFRGPSATLFQLLGLLIEAARDISSVKDVMTGGEGPANEAATRTMARIEQGMKVFSAIYKRVFRSLKSEFKKIYRLNSLYLEQDTYFTLLDTEEAVGPEDYNTQDLDVAPAADPNMVSDAQRMALAEFLMSLRGDPNINGEEVLKRVLEAAGVPDYDQVLVDEVGVDPEIAQKADEIEIKKKGLEIQAGEADDKATKTQAEVMVLQTEAQLNLAKIEQLGRSGSESAAAVQSAMSRLDEQGRGLEEAKAQLQAAIEGSKLDVKVDVAALDRAAKDAADDRATQVKFVALDVERERNLAANAAKNRELDLREREIDIEEKQGAEDADIKRQAAKTRPAPST